MAGSPPFTRDPLHPQIHTWVIPPPPKLPIQTMNLLRGVMSVSLDFLLISPLTARIVFLSGFDTDPFEPDINVRSKQGFKFVQ